MTCEPVDDWKAATNRLLWKKAEQEKSGKFGAAAVIVSLLFIHSVSASCGVQYQVTAVLPLTFHLSVVLVQEVTTQAQDKSCIHTSDSTFLLCVFFGLSGLSLLFKDPLVFRYAAEKHVRRTWERGSDRFLLTGQNVPIPFTIDPFSRYGIDAYVC